MNKLMTKTLILSSLLSLATWAQAADETASAATSTLQPQHPKVLFTQADKDGDGKLNSTEFADFRALQDAQMAKRRAERPDFAALDKNGDGLVSQDEMRANMKARHADCKGRGGDGNGKHGQHFAQSDADKSGTLSEAEYQQMLKQRQAFQARMNATSPDFKTLDTNNDGQLSHEELRAGMAKRIKQMESPANE